MPVGRVAYFVNRYPAVSHSFIRREITALEELGWEVLRYSIRHGEAVDERDVAERARTRALLPPSPRALLLSSLRLLARPAALWRGVRVAAQMARHVENGFLRGMASLPHAMVLLRELERHGIRHAHAHFVTNSTSILRIVRALGGPGYSFTVHGSFEAQPPAVWSTAEKVADARFVVAISAVGRAQLLRITPPAAWHKIVEIRCGLESGSARPPAPLPAEPVLVCIARLSPEKGHLILLRAAAEASARGARFSLRLIGDGAMRADLSSEVERLGLGDSVRLEGWMDEAGIRTALAGSTALLLPSFSEGLPVVLMEAYQAARPVIASRVGGVGELVEAGTSGWLVPPGDVDALATAIAELVASSRERLGEMGRAGAEVVARRHDAQTEAAALAEHFEACLSEDAPG